MGYLQKWPNFIGVSEVFPNFKYPIITLIFLENPLGTDHLQKVFFTASNPILTHCQLKKIKMKQKQQITQK
jgi:hypothetical protein